MVYEHVKRDFAEPGAPRAEVMANLAQQTSRLRVALQDALSVRSGPEEGSDAWLLLNAFVSDDHAEYLAQFEQSGRALAEQGGKLDTRLQGLQVCVDALSGECRTLFADQPAYQFASLSLLFQLHSAALLALTRGYQSVVEQVMAERREMGEHLERRLQTLQRINSISNSAVDQDQTLESTAQKVAEELGVDLCSIFFYDELQRILTLRATNGPRPLGGMHYVLRLGEGYSGWVADKGRPLLMPDTLAEVDFAAESRVYGPEYRGLMALPIIFFGNVERLIGVISVQTAEPSRKAVEIATPKPIQRMGARSFTGITAVSRFGRLQ